MVTTRYAKTEDLTGQKFDHYVVLSFAGYLKEDNGSSKLRAHWLCRCTQCNKENILSIRNLRGKFKNGKEHVHKFFYCQCDLERKLYKKISKTLKLTRLPCHVCTYTDDFSYEENNVWIYYNLLNDADLPCCSEHIHA